MPLEEAQIETSNAEPAPWAGRVARALGQGGTALGAGDRGEGCWPTSL